MSSVTASEEVVQAIRAVRFDPTAQWVVVSFSSKTELCVVASGSEGGLAAVVPHLGTEEPCYALIKYEHLVDSSKNTKFAFVDWAPETVPPFRRAWISTQKGNILQIFSPFHVDLLACDSSDLEEKFILEKIAAASGTRNNEVEVRPSERVVKGGASKNPNSSESSSKSLGIKSMNSIAPKVQVANVEEFQAALLRVHKANDEVDWMSAFLNDNYEVEVLSSGKGSTEDMIASFHDGYCNFGIIRIPDQIDNSRTMKYAYVMFMPSSISPMKKARIGTLQGGFKEIFSPMTVDFLIDTKEELTHASVVEKIGSTSGTLSRVRKN